MKTQMKMTKYVQKKSKARKVIIGNVGESLIGETREVTSKLLSAAAMVSKRMSWFINDDDLFLQPRPLSDEFIQYVCSLLQVDASTVRFITPFTKGDNDSLQLFTYETLSSSQLIKTLREYMSEGEEWSLFPYYFDRGVANLALHLPISMDSSLIEFLAQGGSEILNSKVEFRRMAAAYDLPVAEGTNAYTEYELREAISKLIKKTGSVIIKKDFNAGGYGNVVLSRDPHQREAMGAAETLLLRSDADIPMITHQLWEKLSGFRNYAFVIEVYYPSVAVVYSELEVSRSSLKPKLLDYGDMRMEPIWNGFAIPSVSIQSYSTGEFILCSTVLAQVVRERGYEGSLSVDGMLTADGELMINEINVRNGGCSHIHHVAQKLYGKNYADHYQIFTRNKVKTGVRFEELLAQLRAENLLVEKEHQEGFIILTEDLANTGTIEYMAVGKGKQRALEIESQALQIFERRR